MVVVTSHVTAQVEGPGPGPRGAPRPSLQRVVVMFTEQTYRESTSSTWWMVSLYW